MPNAIADACRYAWSVNAYGSSLIMSSAAALLMVACGDETAACHTEDCGVTGAGAASSSTTTSGSGGQGATALARAYCACMLDSCHDSYHAKFGPDSDEPAAEAACLAEASTLPEAGMDVDAGNFVECRIHFCEIGKTDESVCPHAVGEGACM